MVRFSPSTLIYIPNAGGTGIAPFKGFLEEVEVRASFTHHFLSNSLCLNLPALQACGGRKGGMDLYYGVRDDREVVYGPDLLQARTAGLLSFYGVCYSAQRNLLHSQESPANAQHRPDESTVPMFLDAYITKYAQRLWERLDQGSYVYVCGGAGVSE